MLGGRPLPRQRSLVGSAPLAAWAGEEDPRGRKSWGRKQPWVKNFGKNGKTDQGSYFTRGLFTAATGEDGGEVSAAWARLTGMRTGG